MKIGAFFERLFKLPKRLYRYLENMEHLKTHEHHLLKMELQNLRQTIWGQSPCKIKVVFVLQQVEIWPSTKIVWQAFANDPAFEAMLVALPRVDTRNSQQKTIIDVLLEQEIPFVRGEYYDISEKLPDVVFFQSPYDDQRPERFKVRYVLQHVSRIAYIPYGLEMGGGSENARYQYNLDMQRYAWRVFVRSERAKHMFGHYCDAGNHHVVVTGHPMTEHLLTFSRKETDPELTSFIGGRKAILWNPHFTEYKDQTGWSTFLRWKDVIMDTIEQRDDCVLILRPHPFFFTSLVNNQVMTQEEMDAFRKRIEDSPKMTLDLHSDYRHAIHASSALISDASSFLLLYPVTEKPIMYLPNPTGPGLNEDGEVTNGYYIGTTQEEITAFIDMVAQSHDPRKAERMARYQAILPGPYTGVGERIKNRVLEAISQGC